MRSIAYIVWSLLMLHLSAGLLSMFGYHSAFAATVRPEVLPYAHLIVAILTASVLQVVAPLLLFRISAREAFLCGLLGVAMYFVMRATQGAALDPMLLRISQFASVGVLCPAIYSSIHAAISKARQGN